MFIGGVSEGRRKEGRENSWRGERQGRNAEEVRFSCSNQREFSNS